MNVKLKVLENGDKTSNSGKIAANKLVFYSITNFWQGENDVGKNSEILNMKLRIKDGDKILNLGEIIADRLVFYCIANSFVNTPTRGTIASDYLAIPLVVPLVPIVSSFSALGSTAPDFLTLICLSFGPSIFLISSLPTFL